jgi:hypothetical protein
MRDYVALRDASAISPAPNHFSNCGVAGAGTPLNG